MLSCNTHTHHTSCYVEIMYDLAFSTEIFQALYVDFLLNVDISTLSFLL